MQEQRATRDGRLAGERDDADTEREDHEREPALITERPAQEDNAEDGSREDLDLVQDLEVDGVEVADGHVLQQVLEGVEGSGDGHLPAVAGKNCVVDLLE